MCSYVRKRSKKKIVFLNVADIIKIGVAIIKKIYFRQNLSKKDNR